MLFSGDIAVSDQLTVPGMLPPAGFRPDVLVIESTYMEVEAAMARDFGHLTAAQAARLARDAGVKQLFLTHLSRRYRERDVLEEAQKIFPATVVALG